MTVEPMTFEHVQGLRLQPTQEAFGAFLNPDYVRGLIGAGPSFAGVDKGEVLACAGILPQWPGRAIAWALMGAGAGRQFTAIHKATKRFLEQQPTKRIETWVLSGFQQGHRWIQMLGFRWEGRMESFTPAGEAGDLYARIR